MIHEKVYVAVNKNDEVQWVYGSSSKTRYFRTANYVTKAVMNHNKYYPEDEWHVAECCLQRCHE